MDFAEADALNSAIRRLAMRHRGRALELLARLKLYPGQEFVLMDLAQHGPRIQAQIADAVGCEPPSVTLMVRKLETVGYVRRRPAAHDRRAVLVELTDLGRAVSEQVRDLWITLADDTVDDLPSPTPSELADLLARLAANLVAHVGTAADHPGTASTSR